MKPAQTPEESRPDRAAEAILASISDGFIAADNDWRAMLVNPAATRMLGCRPQDLLGKPILDPLRLDPENAFHACYLAAKEAGEPVFFSGHSEIYGTWLEVRGYPHPGGFTIFFRDVSEERQIHRALIESRNELQSALRTNQRIFETTLDLILVVDRRGNIVQVSPSAVTILGYDPNEMTGRSAKDFLYAEDLDRTRSEMRQARRGRLMRNFESRYVHRDGHPVMLAWTGLWSDAEQQHFFIGRDMTERIRAEERLRRAQRLDSIGQLTGGIAHDFNNLLTVVIGNLDLLEGRLAGDPAAAKLAGKALAASLRGAALTKQLLAFARRQSLDNRVIDVNERVAATMDLLQRTLGEPIEVVAELAPDLWHALVDSAQLESALVNLAINARDAMPRGGRLTIETANRRVDEHIVAKAFDAAPGDYVMLAVSDTGTGMAPDVLAHAFEPFFTTKPAGQGTGLGLSMVYGFAKQSRGHVQIYSEVGEGTSVRLYLPRAVAEDAESPAPAAPEAMPRADPGERILVVEDNPDVRKLVVVQLEDLGYAVAEAGNGEAALKLVEGGESIDLLFTDVVMPGRLSGYDLAHAAQALRPALKILFTSGFPKISRPDENGENGRRHLLSKPYRKAELAAKIRAVLDG